MDAETIGTSNKKIINRFGEQREQGEQREKNLIVVLDAGIE